MPGKRDCISVKIENERKLVKKRLILLGLKELYVKYKDIYKSEHYVGFSTFAKLRPRHCILAGAPGTHSVCLYNTPELQVIVRCHKYWNSNKANGNANLQL